MFELEVGMRVMGCIMAGLFSGVAIGKATEYFTSFDFGPVISIKDRGITGPATVVIQGIGVGMISCMPTVLILAVCIITCAKLDGTYGVSISAVGMLFAALTMISVGKAAAQIIIEVRRQFHGGVPGLMECIVKASQGIPIPEEGDVEPDSDKCVMISTKSSVTEMIAPGAYAILAPMIVGFIVGPRMLMGVLAGAIASGCMNAIMMNNAGGAWDNSKKLCEKLQIKKTDQGKACVVGDTVGDPFKDTSGPALNILIKLMSMVALTIAPLIRGNDDWEGWYFGTIPLGIFLVITGVLVNMKILTWADPLQELSKQGKDVAQDPQKKIEDDNELKKE